MTSPARPTDAPPARLAVHGLAADRGGRRVIEGVDLTLSGGEAIVLRGANGAGKSTLLRAIAGLVPAAAGSIATPDAPDALQGDRLMYLAHDNGLKPALTLERMLRFWVALYGAPADVTAKAAEAARIDGLLGRRCSALSAGQKRRAGFARILIAARPVWLLDEPTASLDADSAAAIARLIDRHTADGGAALIATHEPLPIARSRSVHLGGGA